MKSRPMTPRALVNAIRQLSDDAAEDMLRRAMAAGAPIPLLLPSAAAPPSEDDDREPYLELRPWHPDAPAPAQNARRLDEVVAVGADLHLEMMDNRTAVLVVSFTDPLGARVEERVSIHASSRGGLLIQADRALTGHVRRPVKLVPLL